MDEKERSKYLDDIEYFSAKLEEDPESILFIPLSRAYIKLEKYDEAVDILSAGIDANTEYVSAKTLLAAAYLGQGKPDDAKAILTEVQVLDKNNYMASKLMGDVLRSEGDTKKALMYYRNALMVAPEDAELRNLLEELMSASGIAAHEIEQDVSLFDADDETLEQLGNELAEEVRKEVGEEALGEGEASEEEVSTAIEDIVGEKVEREDEEMSLDSYQQDDGDGEDELEEELVASIEDSIIPTDLSSDEGAVALGDDVMEAAGDGPAPDESEVHALAEELGAELGLPVSESPDETGDTLETPDTGGDEIGMSFFDGVEDTGPDELSDDLKAMINGSEEAPQPEEAPEEDIEAMLEQVQAEQTAEEPAPVAEDAPEESPEEDIEAMLEQVQAEQTVEEPAPVAEDAPEESPEEDIEAMLEQVQAEQTAEEPAPVAEDAPEESPEEDIEAMLEQVQAEQTAEEPEPAAEEVPEETLAEAEIPEDIKELMEATQITEEEPEEQTEEEQQAPEELTELVEESESAETEEIYEASMDELMETGPADETSEEEPEDIDEETREQVNRLENLLEIIKNNASD